MLSIFNKIICLKNKRTSNIISFLIIYLAGIIQISVSLYITKIIFHQMNNAKLNEFVNTLEIATTFIFPLFVILAFIIVMGVFYIILGFVLNKYEFRKRISFKEYIYITQPLYIFKAVFIAIASFITLGIYDIINTPFDIILNNWKYWSSYIGYGSNFVFIIAIYFYLKKYIFKETKKKVLFFSLILPYVVFLIFINLLKFINR